MLKRVASIFLVLFLVACGSQTPAPTAVVNTAAPAATEAPSSTPVPPTDTAVPTATNTPTLTPTKTPAPTATATSTPAAYGPSEFPSNVNPLTGLEVADPTLLDRRPISVKIDIAYNYTRPPFGLSFADIVYNYYHNDGASRFHAIFYGQDAEYAGSIRSGRLLDDLLVRMYKSFFVFGNADEKIRKVFFSSDYSNRLLLEGAMAVCPPSEKTPLCRFEPNVNSILLGSTQSIHAHFKANGVDDTRQNLDGMSFNPRSPANGKPGESVVTYYSQVDYQRWDYDAVTGRYLVSVDAVQNLGEPEKFEPLYDRNNDERVATDNVVVLLVRDGYTQRPPAEIVEIYLSDGQGKGYAFRDGQMYEVTWNRPTRDSVIYLTFPDGTSYTYKPGTTWYAVVNEESLITTDADGALRFKYFIRP